MSSNTIIVYTNTISLLDSNTIEMSDVTDVEPGWIDLAMPKLRTEYGGALSIDDYIGMWMTDNGLTGNLDAQRTFMIDELDAIPVSHPARNDMALNDLRELYWTNVTL